MILLLFTENKEWIQYNTIGFFQPLLCRTEIFKNFPLAYTINEWSKLDAEIRTIDLYVVFRKNKVLLNILRLRVGSSHLNKHKLRHNFADTVNPFMFMLSRNWKRGNYTNTRITLMNELNDIDLSITSRQPNELLRIILYRRYALKG